MDEITANRRDLLLAHADAARTSRRLVTLDQDVPLPEPLDALRVREPDRPKLVAWLAAQGFRSLIARLGLDGPLAGTPEAPAASVTTPRDAPPGQPPFGPYECVTAEARLAEWLEEARAAGVLALDTETTGLDAHTADLVGVSLATAPGRACYVPLRHEGTPQPAQGELGAAAAPAAEGLARLRVRA